MNFVEARVPEDVATALSELRAGRTIPFPNWEDPENPGRSLAMVRVAVRAMRTAARNGRTPSKFMLGILHGAGARLAQRGVTFSVDDFVGEFGPGWGITKEEADELKEAGLQGSDVMHACEFGLAAAAFSYAEAVASFSNAVLKRNAGRKGWLPLMFAAKDPRDEV